MVLRKRLNIKGLALVFVTTTVVNWSPILTENRVIKIVLEHLKLSLEKHKVSLVSYVIMPNHFHALLGFPEIQHLSDFMKTFKSITSREIKKLKLKELASNNYRVWQPRFDDLIIKSEKQYKIKMDYIHNNPVKSGLVGKATEWPYSSASEWLINKNGIMNIDKDFKWLSGE